MWPQPSKPYNTRWRRSRARGGCACWALDLGHPLAPHRDTRTPRYYGRPSPASGPSSTRACGRSTGVDTGTRNRGFDAGRRIALTLTPKCRRRRPRAWPPGRGCVPTSRRELWSWARPEGRTTDGSGRGGGVLDHRRPEGATAAVGRWVRAGAVACGAVAANFGRQVRPPPVTAPPRPLDEAAAAAPGGEEGAAMSSAVKDQLQQMSTTYDSLLLELNMIWDEVGEPDMARDRMLLELEQEWLDVYRRKVDQANRCRAQLRQAIADAEAELAGICSAMSEPPIHVRQSNQKLHGLREELNAIVPYLEEMRKKKVERWDQFVDVIEQIKKVASEIRPSDFVPFIIPVDQSDLSLRKLDELTKELQSLQKEKSDRLKQVMEHLSTLHLLCEVLGVDFKQTVYEVHPSLEDAKASRFGI
uniref:65-kDa microtubule-associated protein 3 n=1 Tax=Zea mays TaxID=4577 RepID=A0A804RPX8_MAIZE